MKGKTAELSYMAGFFDGEGCITMTRTNRGTRSLQVQISHTKEYILRYFQFHFGGRMYCFERKPGVWSPCWFWIIARNNAQTFLEELLPYLKLKKAEAEIAIGFQKRRRIGIHLTDKQKAVDEAEMIMLQQLKGRASRARARNEL